MRKINSIEQILLPGLEYTKDFLDTDQQEYYLNQIDLFPWHTGLKRRVQHYGYIYNYKSKKINANEDIISLPKWAVELSTIIYELNISPYLADQVIINEYLPGQGISSHIDSPSIFADIVISISLGSKCVMNFNYDNKEKESILLTPGSLLKLSGEARYKWKHSIPARRTDYYDEIKITRSRRVSITLRKMILDQV
jgi:alkylated DNA repair dioxygenase AlkB